jgi:hypothetical protein
MTAAPQSRPSIDSERALARQSTPAPAGGYCGAMSYVADDFSGNTTCSPRPEE